MQIPEDKIREYILAGHPPKTAIAMAIARSRVGSTNTEELTDKTSEMTSVLESKQDLPDEQESIQVERVLAGSSLSDSAKNAILARKQSRIFKA